MCSAVQSVWNTVCKEYHDSRVKTCGCFPYLPPGKTQRKHHSAYVSSGLERLGVTGSAASGVQTAGEDRAGRRDARPVCQTLASTYVVCAHPSACRSPTACFSLPGKTRSATPGNCHLEAEPRGREPSSFHPRLLLQQWGRALGRRGVR